MLKNKLKKTPKKQKNNAVSFTFQYIDYKYYEIFYLGILKLIQA